MIRAGRIAAFLMLDTQCRERFRSRPDCFAAAYRRTYDAFWRAWQNLNEDEQRFIHGPYGPLPVKP